jgi:transposase
MRTAPCATTKEPLSGDEPENRPAGRTPLLDDLDHQVLMELVVAEPQATVRQLQRRMEQECGKSPSRSTMWYAMRLLGLSKKKPITHHTPRPRSPSHSSYRYREYHRREPDRQRRRYPSDLSDQEWALVEAMLRPKDPRGGQSPHSRRSILEAILYVLRTGCQWRMLPLDFPPWKTVYTNFRRWTLRGVFHRILETLRVTYRHQVGREPQPSGGIIDSQSVKTTEKGGPKGTMRAKRSRAGSVICSSILWV